MESTTYTDAAEFAIRSLLAEADHLSWSDAEASDFLAEEVFDAVGGEDENENEVRAVVVIAVAKWAIYRAVAMAAREALTDWR